VEDERAIADAVQFVWNTELDRALGL